MTEAELNEVLKPYFRKLDRKLNINTIKTEKHPGDVYLVPTILKLGNYTKVKGSQHAFNLHAHEVGVIKDVVKTDADREIVVIRRLISYSMASRMFINPENIKYQLNPVITEMLLTLKEARGFSHRVPNYGNCYGTFLRPGTNELYVRDMEDCAAFEIRLYSDTWPGIDPSLRVIDQL